MSDRGRPALYTKQDTPMGCFGEGRKGELYPCSNFCSDNFTENFKNIESGKRESGAGFTQPRDNSFAQLCA